MVMCDLALAKERMDKGVVVDPVFGDKSLLEKVYSVLLCTHIWTRPGKTWYDPNYPGYSGDVDRVLREFERVFVP
jgi:hypothetical protein